MAIRLQCSACNKTLQVADSAAGKKARCPSCQAINDVPAANAPATPVTPPKTAPPKTTPPAAAAPPKPAPAKPTTPPSSPPSTPPSKSSAPATPASNPETILVACSSCGKACRVLKANAGKTVQCPHCKGKIVVPGGKPVSKTPPTAKPITPAPSSGGSVDIFGSVPSSPPASSSTDIFGSMPASQPSYDMFGGSSSSNSNNALWNDLGDQSGGGGGGGGWQSMGPASSNAYSPPSYGGSGGGYSGGGGGYRSTERSPALYIISGVFIALWGFLVVISACIRIGGIAIVLANAPAGSTIRWEYIGAYLVGAFIGLIIGGIQLFGGIACAMRNNLGLARTGAILCTIPCFGGLCFPFGIWAVVLLFSGSHRRDFGE